ncbi:MAG: 3-phosphoshikimate 1-carboxyvinyltransferase [Chitinophagales bacterium]|nr:3-phosphoshikimate 1-carboxyvinyltransferase [Chitinophagales bacterium]
MVYKISKHDRQIKGHIYLRGSKSISNRVLIMEALMDNTIEKRNLSDSNDTAVMSYLLNASTVTLDAHDAGTVFRFMTAYLAFREGSHILTGSERMKQRPVGDLVDPLRELGARIEYLGKQQYPPLKITGGSLRGGKIKVHSGISSQFASALLMIAPCMEQGLTLELTGEVVSEPYIEMTLALMQHFDVRHERNGQVIHVPAQRYKPRNIFIESDWSAASYYYEMAAFSTETDLTLSGLLQQSFQGDAKIAALMERFGIQTTYTEQEIKLSKSEQTGTFDFFLNDQPDLAPALLTTCGGLSQTARFTGLSHLQYKESDRAAALQQELAKCGIALQKNGDTITTGGKFLPGHYTFSTYADHRMAMSFAPLAMLCGHVYIDDPMVVKKSYPGYWDDLQLLGFNINEL